MWRETIITNINHSLALHARSYRSIKFCSFIITSIIITQFTGSIMNTTFKESNSNIIQIHETRPRYSTAPGSSDPTGDEWPMFRGQLNHTGTSTTIMMKGSGKIWSYPTGFGVTSSPAVTCGCVYIGGFGNQVYCLNATTGALIWSHTVSGIVSSSPAVSGGRMYVGSDDYRIYCLNTSTGSFIWSYATGDYVISSPAVASGCVYVGSVDNRTYCLNATTGAFIWSYTTGNAVESSPAVVSGRVYIGSFDHKVYCLNAITGSFIWSYTTGDRVYSSPAIAGGRMYVGSADNKIYCLNAATGAFIWSHATGNDVWSSSPAVANGCIYVGSDDHKVYCLNATTGALVWSFTTGAEVDSSPAVANGRVYVGCFDSSVCCFPMILFPAAPQNLVEINGNWRVTLRWQLPADKGGSPITGYSIYRGTSPGTETFLATLGNVTTWTDTNVTNGQTYYYEVSALNGAGEGPRSSEISATPAPGPPSFLGSSNPTGDEWPMRGGQLNHTGVSLTTPLEGKGLTWSYSTGSYVYSSPAVANGCVYVGSDDHNVYCLNASTGSFIWFYNTEDWVQSSPTIAGGRVYVGSDDHDVYCLNATTGSFIWSYATSGIVISSPAVASGFVYVGSWDDNMYCLNATTGTFVWSYTTNGKVESSPAIAGGRVYLGSDDGIIYCLNATMGSLIWSYGTNVFVSSSPAVASGRVYVGSGDGNIYCLNATTGTFIWSYTTGGNVNSSPAMANGCVYVGSGTYGVFCLNAITGLQEWNYTTGWVDSSPAVACGCVYVGSGDKELYCLNASTGASEWNFTTSDWVRSSPAIADGHLYIGSYDGKIYCLPTILLIPSISHPANITCAQGINGNTISWWIAEARTGTTSYTIYRNGTSIASGSWISGKPVTLNVDGLPIGSYNYTIIAIDGIGGNVSDMVFVRVILYVPLSIKHLSDIIYTMGQIGNVISWNITGTTTDESLYTIYRNGTWIATDAWTSGTLVMCNVDGLPVGNYNYTIIVTDGFGGSAQDIINVIVQANVPPVLSHPNNITYKYGALNNDIYWVITDSSTGVTGYTVYRNGVAVAAGSWTSGTPVILNIDGLFVGSYNFTIVAYDGLGGSVQDTVFVTVVAANQHPYLSTPFDGVTFSIIMALGVVGLVVWSIKKKNH